MLRCLPFLLKKTNGGRGKSISASMAHGGFNGNSRSLSHSHRLRVRNHSVRLWSFLGCPWRLDGRGPSNPLTTSGWKITSSVERTLAEVAFGDTAAPAGELSLFHNYDGKTLVTEPPLG